jgi:phosphate starvation-inducible PhoH-like protein
MNPVSFDMSEISRTDDMILLNGTNEINEINENEGLLPTVEIKESTNSNNICDTTFFSIEPPALSKKRGKKAKKQNEKEIMKNYFDEIAMKSSEIVKETAIEDYTLDDCNAYYIDTSRGDKQGDQSYSHTNTHIFRHSNPENPVITYTGNNTEDHKQTNTCIGSNSDIYSGNNTNGTPQKGSKRGSSTKTTTGKKRGGSDGGKNDHTNGKSIPNAIEKKMMKPKNASQEQYVNYLNLHDKKIIFAIGPAGTGKTMFATQYAMKHFLLGNYDKIIFTRPTVSVDEDIGFLPGSIEEKLSPWLRPIFDILYEFITVKEVQTFLEEKVFEMAPIGYLRGRTFKRSFIIADEMQNCTKNQMKMLLTRLGENSRMVVTGDLEQHDRTGETNGLADFLSKLRKKRSESIELVEFERNDILREPIIKEVLEIYSL